MNNDNKAIIGVLGALLGISLYKRKKGSQTVWLEQRSSEWQKKFCIADDKKISFGMINGGMGAARLAFESLGWKFGFYTDNRENTENQLAYKHNFGGSGDYSSQPNSLPAVDVLYGWSDFTSFEGLTNLSTHSTLIGDRRPKSEDFFDIYQYISKNLPPVFILELDPKIDGLEKSVELSNFMKKRYSHLAYQGRRNVLWDVVAPLCGMTINLKLHNKSKIPVYRESHDSIEVLDRLPYHTSVYELNASDFGLPAHRKRVYIIGFLAKTARGNLVPPPEFYLNLDYPDIPISSVLEVPVQKDSIFRPLTLAAVTRLKSTNTSAKFFDPNDSQYTEIAPELVSRYDRLTKKSSAFVVDSSIPSGHRMLSDKELKKMFGFPPSYLLDNLSATAMYRSFATDSAVSILRSVGESIQKLLRCPPYLNPIVDDFLTSPFNIRPLVRRGDTVTIGGMFSGLGGFEAGISTGLAKWDIASKVSWDFETNPFSQAIFSSAFPEAKSFGDVNDLRVTPSKTTIISMGFPCPDISYAGLRKGITSQTRSGSFFPAWKLVEKIQPRFILLENVAAILNYSLPAQANPLSTVLEVLKLGGWNVEWAIMKASSFGSLQRRRRWFAIAHKETHPIWIEPTLPYAKLGINPKEGKYSSQGIMFNGKVYYGQSRIPLSLGLKGKSRIVGENPYLYPTGLFPTPCATDWKKNSTGGFRMRAQERRLKSPGKMGLRYPQPLPEGWVWREVKDGWKAFEVSKPNYTNPNFVEKLMGFPVNWTNSTPSSPVYSRILNPLSWTDGSWETEPLVLPRPYPQNVGKRYEALGNCIVPQIPAWISFAVLGPILGGRRR